MGNFEGSNLIVKIKDKIYQLDNIEELIEIVFGEEYMQLEDIKKLLVRYETILPFAVSNRKIITSSVDFFRKTNKKKEEIDGSLYIEDESSYFLSLCELGQLQILEKKDANIFTKDMDKSMVEGNYVVVNKFAKELLNKRITKEPTNEKSF